MRPPAKKPYHHGDLRRALVDAALTLVSQGGLAPLTLRQVARAALVSPAAPYAHFADKSALLAAVAEEGFHALARSMRASAARHRRPRARLEAMGVAYVRFAVAHPAHFQVMFSSTLADRWREPPLNQVSLSTFELLVEAVRAVLTEAGHTRADPFEAALLGWSTVHGLSSLWLEGPIQRVSKTKHSIEHLATVLAKKSADAILTSAAPRTRDGRDKS